MLLAVVPARGGSKGVKNKNLRKIGNRSLVQIATDYALSESEVSRTIVTTDSIEVVREFGDGNLVETFASLENGLSLKLSKDFYIHKRKPEHSSDSSPTIEAVQDILATLEISEFDSLILLQPTSPFREPGEVRRVIETLERTKTNSCVSAKRFDSPHPSKAFYLNENGILNADNFKFLAIPRQKLESLYVFDGAFYLAKIELIQRRNSLLDLSTSIYLREGTKTLNIDNEEDMEFAVALVQQHESQKEII